MVNSKSETLLAVVKQISNEWQWTEVKFVDVIKFEGEQKKGASEEWLLDVTTNSKLFSNQSAHSARAKMSEKKKEK